LNPEKTKLAVIFDLENDLDELKLIGTDLKQLLWAEDNDKNDIKDYLNRKIEENETFLQIKRKKDNELRMFYSEEKNRLRGQVSFQRR
jgi:hypothetical protein